MTRQELHDHALQTLKSTISLKDTSTALAQLVLERKASMKDVFAVMQSIGSTHKDLVRASQ